MVVEEELSQILANIYGDSQEYVESIIEQYRVFYDLPVITKTEDVGPRLFQFYRRGEHFVVIAICNEFNEILIVNETLETQQSDLATWQLVGGFVQKDETIEDVCDRFISEKTGLQIDEVEPIAVVKNEFHCQNRTISHHGLAFLIYTRGIPRFPENCRGIFATECPDQLAYANKEIILLALKKARAKKAFTPYDEVEISNRRAIRLFIHKNVINKPFDYLSSRLLKQRIRDYCGKAETILDVACGNDTLILELAQTAKLCMANDISWSVLRQLRKVTKAKNVIFCNHNAIDLPFARKFDVVICKNVLHHMHNLTEVVALTSNLQRVGKKIIIVDVENPNKSSLQARLWHEYYVRFLGDRGHYFMSRHEFEKAVSHIYRGSKIAFDLVTTVKGSYMFAVIETTV